MGERPSPKPEVCDKLQEVLYPSFTISQGLRFPSGYKDTQLQFPTLILKGIKKSIQTVIAHHHISLWELTRIIDLLSASIQAIFSGPLHYHTLQRLKAFYLRQGLDYSIMVPLSSEALEESMWWLKHMASWNGKAIFGFAPDIIIESDASLVGWGARCGDTSNGGKWSE